MRNTLSIALAGVAFLLGVGCDSGSGDSSISDVPPGEEGGKADASEYAKINFRFLGADSSVVETLGCVIDGSLTYTEGTADVPAYYTVSVEPHQDVPSNAFEVALQCETQVRQVEGVDPATWITDSDDGDAPPDSDSSCTIEVGASAPTVYQGRFDFDLPEVVGIAAPIGYLDHSHPGSDIIGSAGSYILDCQRPPHASLEAGGYSFEMHWYCLEQGNEAARYRVRVYTQTNSATGKVSKRAELRVVQGDTATLLGTGPCSQ